MVSSKKNCSAPVCLLKKEPITLLTKLIFQIAFGLDARNLQALAIHPDFLA
jgi:hypothetical protein